MAYYRAPGEIGDCHDLNRFRIERSCTASAIAAANAEMAHTASQPLAASALVAMKAPMALPDQTLRPKTVLERLRASGASELTTV
ncbi:MAG TPA: hypothetical protein VE756_03435, partial [Burkholderiales bacterium]|nr:hypothetical protein [Burkholderiales bacterium]